MLLYKIWRMHAMQCYVSMYQVHESGQAI